MSFFEKNRGLILSRNPQLGSRLERVTEAGSRAPEARSRVPEAGSLAGEARSRSGERRLHVEPSAAGDPTATLDGKHVHSRFDPRQEAARIAESAFDGLSDLYILYHVGLAYVAEALMERHPGIQAVLVEPDTALLADALEARDLGALLSNPNVHLFSDAQPEALALLLDELAFSRIKVVRLKAMSRENASYFDVLDGIVGSYGLRKRINMNTLRRFGRLWLKNMTDNIPVLLETPGVNVLQGLFTDIPVLVLASGPSLDTVLPHLRELRKRCLIVAVDTSLRACLSHGVEPDYLVVVDPQYWNTRHLDHVRVRTAVMVSESSAHPTVFRRVRTPVVLTGSLFPLGRHLEAVVGEKGKIGAGGSVATTAWDFARLLGGRPIIMAGLDLGFPHRMTHFRGAFFERLFFSRSGRLEPAEGLSFGYLRQADPFTVSSNSGGKVLTDQRMIVYKWWFENQLKIHDGVVTENLSAEGVRIQGMPRADLGSLLALPPRREEIERRRGRGLTLMAESRRRNERPENRTRLVRALEGLIADMRELERLSARAQELTEQARSAAERGGRLTGLEALSAVDGAILRSASRYVVSFLLQPIIHRITSGAPAEGIESGGHDGAAALEDSRVLYREIGGSSSFHIGLLKKALDRLTGSGG